jgi:ABC-type glycerol-3-phosphate transport system substrate-binding protein
VTVSLYHSWAADCVHGIKGLAKKIDVSENSPSFYGTNGIFADSRDPYHATVRRMENEEVTMKNGLRILAGMLLLLGLAVTVNAQTKSFTNKELTVAAFQGAYGRDYWDAVAAEFMKAYPGTKVTVQADPQIGNQIRPKVVAGNPPDVIYLNIGESSGVTAGLIKEKGMLDLTDLFGGKALEGNGLLKNAILPGVLDTLTCSPYGDGRIYLAPYNYGVMGIWYTMQRSLTYNPWDA